MITNDVTINPLLNLQRIAELTTDPKIKSYYCKNRHFSWTVKIINYTDLDIAVYTDGDLYINDKFWKRINSKCELIFFRLKNRPNIVCYDKKSLITMKQSQFFVDINMNGAIFQEDTTYKLYKMSEETPKIEIFTQILLGMTDKGSILSETKMPNDIFTQFIYQHDRCVQLDIDQLLLEQTSISKKEKKIRKSII